MDRKRMNERGLVTWGLTMSAVAFVWLLAAPLAWAVSGHGSAELRFAQHGKGRTLSGQGVSVIPGSPAQRAGDFVSLPISSLDFGTAPAAGSEASLVFKRGKKSVALGGLRFDLAAGTLNGKLGGTDLAVFRLGAVANVNARAGKVTLSEGSLRLTDAAAEALKQKLGLERALVRKGVGMAWLSAQANPVRVTKQVVSGGIGWGFKSSWRDYVLATPPAGSEEVLGGATATGPLTSPATTYGFPARGGSLAGVLDGAVDSLTLTGGGAVKWAKPGHGINEVRFSNLEVEIGSGGSWLIGDIRTEIGPPAESEHVRIAELKTTAVTPVWSADGNTVTWPAVPATLAAEAATSFAGFYDSGEELDPVTITAGLG